MYEKDLQQLGLMDKEAKVYLAALELGPETAQNIAKKACVNRPTTYVQIETLKKKGLMSEFVNGKKTYFVVESPDRLKNLVSKEIEELELKKIEIDSLLPKLSQLSSGGNRPKVRFFEGKEGAAAMRADFLNSADDLIESFTNLDKLLKTFPEQNNFSKERVESGIESHVIYTRQNGPVVNATEPKLKRAAKYIDPERLNINADVTIYGDKVAFVSYGQNPVGVIIENEEISETLRSIFYKMWRELP